MEFPNALWILKVMLLSYLLFAPLSIEYVREGREKNDEDS